MVQRYGIICRDCNKNKVCNRNWFLNANFGCNVYNTEDKFVLFNNFKIFFFSRYQII